MSRRALHIGLHLLLACLLCAVIGGASLAAGTQSDALACPNGETTLLEGTAPPGEALLVSFAGRVVGGGVADRAGQWAIPLVVQARPGVYLVQVSSRGTGETRAQLTCYVDLPVGTTLTPIATVPVAAPLSEGATTAAPAVTAAASPAVLRTDTEPVATEEAVVPSPATSTATASAEKPTAAPEQPGTPSPTMTVTASASPTTEPLPSATPSPEEPLSALQLAHIQADDPSEEELLEYVVLANDGDAPVDIAGYKLQHVQQAEDYLLPSTVLPSQSLLIVYSGAGEDAPEDGVVFWPTSTARWRVGDTAALVDPNGVTVHSLNVTPPEDESLPDDRAAGQAPQETAACAWTQPLYTALFGVRLYLCKEQSQ